MPNFVFVNDRLVPGETATIAVSDRGFTLGDGAFETIAVTGGTAQHLDRHLARLEDALQILRFNIRPSAEQIADSVGDILSAHDTQIGALRITVSRGVGARGLMILETATPTLVITVSDGLPPHTPVSAWLSRSTRRNEHSPLSRIKSLGYLDNILALEEARANSADDAIMLNTRGKLACASAANLFLVKSGQLFTPPTEDGVLPGLVRADIIEHMDVAAVTLDEATLRDSDEAFLTNSLSVRPLIKVDDHTIGNGAVGPVTAEIIQRFGPT